MVVERNGAFACLMYLRLVGMRGLADLALRL